MNKLQAELREIPFSTIIPDHTLFSNSRTNLTKIKELANSIYEGGLMHPITVWETTEGLLLVAGRRRYAAISMLREEYPQFYHDITVSVEADLTPEEAFAKNLEENIHQESLNAADEALAVIRLYEKVPNQEKVGKLLGKSQPWVSLRVSLVKNLIPAVLEALKVDSINFTQANAIAKLLTEKGKPDKKAQLVALDGILTGEADARSLVEKVKKGRSKAEVVRLKQLLIKANYEFGGLGDLHRASVIQTLNWLTMGVSTDDMLFVLDVQKAEG